MRLHNGLRRASVHSLESFEIVTSEGSTFTVPTLVEQRRRLHLDFVSLEVVMPTDSVPYVAAMTTRSKSRAFNQDTKVLPKPALVKDTTNVTCPTDPSMSTLSRRQQQTKTMLIHQRLAHTSFDKITEMGRRGMVHGIPRTLVLPDDPCLVCLKAKAKALPHGKSVSTDKLGPGIQIHMDFAFSNVISYHGFSSILTCIDAWSRFLWVFCTRSK
jgi:hypothetical protein